MVFTFCLLFCLANSLAEVYLTDLNVKSNVPDFIKNLTAVDPTLFAGVKSYAGYSLVSNNPEWKLYFWYFPAESVNVEEASLVVWLPGDLAQTAMEGLFERIGPLKVVDGKAQKMADSWGKNYSLLFVEVPVGVGFSHGSERIKNQTQIGQSLLTFFNQFLQVFPESRKAPLFLMSEFLGAKYATAFGHFIHEQNKAEDKNAQINLKGLILGNGYIDPPSHLARSPLLLELGLLAPCEAKQIQKLEQTAKKLWNEGHITEYIGKSGMALSSISVKLLQIDLENYLLNFVKKPEPSYVDFMKSGSISSAIHAEGVGFDYNNVWTYGHMAHDAYLSVKPWLEELLEANYAVLSYSGQLDLIATYSGSVNLHKSLIWSKSEEYHKSKRQAVLDSNNNIVGFVKSGGNLVEALVRNASRYALKDQPSVIRTLADSFINKYK